MAWSKRIVLVIGTGLAAGALFAGMTTRSLRSSFVDHHERTAGSTASSSGVDEEQSWLERGFAVIGGPAWPFGQHAWDPEPDDQDGQDLSPPGYAPYPPDQGGDDTGRADGLAFHDGYTEDSRAPYPDQQDIADDPQASAPDEGAASIGDEAAQAAARAGDAAKDVIAAERSK